MTARTLLPSALPRGLAAGLLVLPLAACTAPGGPADDARAVTGADRDAHDCIASAGQSWSRVLGQCIRPFEAGRQLLPVGTRRPEEAVFATFVVFSADRSRAEVFSVDGRLPAVLGRDPRDPQAWSSGSARLRAVDGRLELGLDGRVILREAR